LFFVFVIKIFVHNFYSAVNFFWWCFLSFLLKATKKHHKPIAIKTAKYPKDI